MITCTHEGCGREFLSDSAAFDHAQAVHTFGDIQRVVQEALRQTFGREGNYNTTPSIPWEYCWINDIADDWVVFDIENGPSEGLWKVSYALTDADVTFGTPVEVHRVTTYEPVGGPDPTPVPTAKASQGELSKKMPTELLAAFQAKQAGVSPKKKSTKSAKTGLFTKAAPAAAK